MNGKGILIGVFCVAAAGGAVLDSQDQPKPGVAPLEAVGNSVLVWATFIVVGVIAGVVYAILAGTLADRHPAHRWTIWAGLAGVTVAAWTVVAQFASWFNTVSGLFVMVTTAIVLDLAFGGLKHPPAPARRDEPWQEAVLPLVVDLPSDKPRVPSWADLAQIDRDLRRGVTLVWLANRWGMEPDVLAASVRDYRLAEDRWEDTLAGRSVPQQPPAPRLGRDLSEEIRDTGWDAFLAATPMRRLHQAPDPGHPGADAVLYEVTSGPWAGERVLQVIDASPEGGINRRVGIPVGRDHTDAGAALADTWGLDPEQYQPLRHT